MPKPDNLAVADNAEKQNLTGGPVTKTEAETESAEIPPPPEDKSSNALFAAVTNLNAYLTTLHAALPPHTALLLFSGHSDPRSMSTLAARRAEYQASQQQQQGEPGYWQLWSDGGGEWGALEHGG